MKFGARNNLMAEVKDIKKGEVMSQVKVQLKGSDHMMNSVMTTDSVNDLGLNVGDSVRVVSKAVNVMLVKD